MPSYTARRQHGSCTFQPVHSGVPRACGEHPTPIGSRRVRVSESNKASAVSLSCSLTSLSETRSRFRFQHQMQWARKSSSPRMPPLDRTVISTRRQSDTSASPSRTNEISTSFLPRFAGKPWHRHDFPALRGPARVLLSPAAYGRQSRSSHPVRGLAYPGQRFALRASRGFQAA